jgi:hypothetical protein
MSDDVKFRNVTVDDKGRCTLGKGAAGLYRATIHPEGRIVLEPAKVYTEAEVAVLRNPEVSEALERGFSDTPPGMLRDPQTPTLEGID